MPFFEPAKKLTGCVSLQVQKHFKNTIKNKYCLRKRAYLFASSGSITIEATIALSVFMMFMLFIQSFMLVVHSYMSMQVSINNIATETAKNQYYLQMTDEVAQKSKTWSDIKKEIEDKVKKNAYILPEMTKKLQDGAEVLYLSQRLMKEIGSRTLGEQLCDVKKLTLGNSSIENGIVDMVVEYEIKIPYINKYMSIAQRGRVHEWTGEDISKSIKEVYITKNGDVYHKSKDCSYLIVRIRKAYYSQIDELRNDNGGKYKKCQLCVNKKLNKSTGIFIAEDGEKFHVDLKCSGIKRNVMAVDISQIGNRRQCSRCGQGE